MCEREDVQSSNDLSADDTGEVKQQSTDSFLPYLIHTDKMKLLIGLG